MKRLAVALNTRREQPDTPASPTVPDIKKRGFFSKQPSRGPSELKVPANTYSSSSSDGSVVQTPEPDEELETPTVTPTPSTSRWASWIKSKSSKPKIQPVATLWDHTSTDAPSKRPPIVSSQCAIPDSEDESDHYDDESPTPPLTPPSPIRSRPSHSPARSTRVLQPATLLRAQMNIRAIALASLIPPTPSPPFVHLPSTPLFPRSMNPSRSLKRLQTTRTVLHKTILLRRLESRTLTASDNESIEVFGHRPKYVVPKSRRLGIDEDAMSDVKKVRPYSRGVQTWLDRPCFEERCVMWTWDSKGREIVARGIVGCGKAVALLEFSEGLEALAGYGSGPPPSPTAPAASQSAPQLSSLHRTSAPVQIETISTGSSTPNVSSGPPTPTTITPLSAATPRKVLRFMSPDPEDEEDNVPLGYQVRRRRGRELQIEERERRLEERERQLEERERQTREEARMKKVYAEEVVAARARRDAVRSGSMHEAEIEKAKDRRSSYTRAAYDPAQLNTRRLASEPDSRTRPSSLSRPPSMVDVPVTTTPTKPRPLSARSEHAAPSSRPQTLLIPPVPPLPNSQPVQSVEDIQEGKRRRRQSNISEDAGSTRSRTPSAPPGPPRPSMYTQSLPRAYSSGSGMNGMVPIPPLPVMPVFPVMPGTPQFFIPQSQPQMQLLYPSFNAPLLPPIRPGLPVSRSTEGLVARPRHSRRQESSGNAAPSSRGTSHVGDVQPAPRMSMQGPVLSFKQPASHHTSGSRGPRPSQPSR